MRSTTWEWAASVRPCRSRHITGRLAVKGGAKLPTTRVDFDHISPDYPARKPGELLASLAEELRLYGGPGQGIGASRIS